jgi:hypothetical protein
MPTILINTNVGGSVRVGKSSSNDSESEKEQEQLDADFRQDLNAIITRLLNKSQTVSKKLF